MRLAPSPKRRPEKEAMSQLNENHISDEDVRLARICHLERPLKAYGASPRYIRSAYVSSLIISTTTTILSILLLIAGHVAQWPDSLTLNVAGVFVFVVGGAFGLTAGPDARKLRLIVCEAGLLEVRKVFKYNRVTHVMYYKYVKKIKKSYFSRNMYYVTDGGGNPFVISASYYQDADDLLALIREQLARAGKQV